jgi:hypothetical protein
MSLTTIVPSIIIKSLELARKFSAEKKKSGLCGGNTSVVYVIITELHQI